MSTNHKIKLAITLGIIGSLSVLGLAKFWLYNSLIVTYGEGAELGGLADLIITFPGAIALIVGSILGFIAISRIKDNPKNSSSYFHLMIFFIILPVFISCFFLDIIILLVAAVSILCPVVATFLIKNLSQKDSQNFENQKEKYFYMRMMKMISRLGIIMFLLSSIFYFPGHLEKEGIGNGGFFLVFLSFLLIIVALTELYLVKNYRKAGVLFLVIASMLFLITPAHPIDITLLLIMFCLFISAGLLGLHLQKVLEKQNQRTINLSLKNN